MNIPGRQSTGGSQFGAASRIHSPPEPHLHPVEVSNLADDWKGKPLDAGFSRGPVANRNVTDFVCCVIFLVSLAAAIVVVLFHAPSSKLNLLNKPKDSQNNICGYSTGFEDYPYLFMINFGDKRKSVCVKDCPKFDYNQIRYNSTGSLSYVERPLAVVTFSGLEQAALKAGTKWDGVSEATAAKDANDPALFLFNPKEARGYYSEASFMNYLRRSNVDCAANAQVAECKYNPDKQFYIYDTRPSFLKVCLPRSPTIMAKVDDNNRFGNEDLLGSLKKVWLVFLLVGLSTLLLNIVIIGLTVVFSKFAVWTATILGLLATFVIFMLLLFLAFDVSGATTGVVSMSASYSNPTIDSALAKMKPHVWILYTAAALTFILLAWLGFKVVRNSRYFNIAAVLISVSGKLLISKPARMLTTVACFSVQVVVMVTWLYMCLLLHTSGPISSPPSSPQPSFTYSAQLISCQVGVSLVMLWSLAAVNNLGDYLNSWETSEQYFAVRDPSFLVDVQYF